MTFWKNSKKTFFLSLSGVHIQNFNHITKKLHHIAQNTIFGLKIFLETPKMTFSKNQKNPFLDSGQIDVDSNLQGCRPISVVMRPFTSSKIAILAVFFR